jgi:hypothetical protein
MGRMSDRSSCTNPQVVIFEAYYNAARCRRLRDSCAWPRYSANRHYILVITARPRLLSVTESIALPPRPRGDQMSNISNFSVREWMVPPVLLPIFFALLIAAAVLIQW